MGGGVTIFPRETSYAHVYAKGAINLHKGKKSGTSTGGGAVLELVDPSGPGLSLTAPAFFFFFFFFFPVAEIMTWIYTPTSWKAEYTTSIAMSIATKNSHVLRLQ
eukprot:FR741731.1.p2 GENE.FR741731.1~~FR741731.1.p2  ORF type:complete len:105 (-),score=37.23 FR741731.1:651-965(-)